MKTMNDERVGWKEIEAWDVHLHPPGDQAFIQEVLS